MRGMQSRAGYVRQHLAEIESRLDLGIRRRVIVDELRALGYNCSEQELSNDLTKARQWASKRSVPTSSLTINGPAAIATQASEPETSKILQRLRQSVGMAFKGSPSLEDENNLF